MVESVAFGKKMPTSTPSNDNLEGKDNNSTNSAVIDKILLCNLHISSFPCNLNSSLQHTLVFVLFITQYSSRILFLLCITLITREFSDLNNSLWLPLFINSTLPLSLSLFLTYILSLSFSHSLSFSLFLCIG